MDHRPFRRATALAIAALLMTASAVAADGVRAIGDFGRLRPGSRCISAR